MNRYKNIWHGSFVRIIEYGLDIFVMIFSLFTAIQLNLGFAYGYFFGWIQIVGMYWYFYWFLVLIYVLATAIMFKMYHTTIVNNTYRNSIKNTMLAIVFMNIPLIVYNFIRIDNFIFETPWYLFVVVGIEIVTYALYKYIFYRILSVLNKQYILIVGQKKDVTELASKFILAKERHRVIKYLYFVESDKVVDQLIFKLIDEVDNVYITEHLDVKSKEMIIDYASLMNYKEVFVVPKKYDIMLLDSKFETVDDTMVLRSQNMHLSFEMRFIKRTIDIIVSTIGLVIAAIPMLIVALIIKLQDGGPVFYKQERFKRDNKPFYILKFRSMIQKQTEAMEQTLATRNDKRITPFGKFIRATRIDELPQLLNVFKGEMTLVGPRPFMKSVVDEATANNPDFRYRSNVKPGITGLSHVYGRYDTTPEERLRYDLLYVRRCSLWLDIKIIFLTIIVVFSKDMGLGRDGSLSFEALMVSKNVSLEKVLSTNDEVYLVQRDEIKTSR